MSEAALKTPTENNVIVSTNPARNFEILGEVAVSSEAEIAAKVSAARKAQATWWAIGLEKRIEYIRKLIPLFTAHKDEFARRTSLEMGMPVGLSENMVAGAISSLKWNCDQAPEFLKNEIMFEDDHEINEIVYEPHGVMACIVAWNFPLPNFVVNASQALLAGNTIVMKYSEEVPLFAEYLESIIAKAGLPEGVISFVHGAGDVGKFLSEQDIDFISFTGSSGTGRKLYQSAAERLLPVALELGGSSPGIVFSDCELTDEFIEALFWKRFLNSAQFCNGLKRLIVHSSLFDECVAKLAAYAQSKTIGVPTEVETELGPLVADSQVLQLEEQVKDALDKGAKLHCGGRRPDGLQGAYYEPTILTNITRDMRVWDEEVFGPALPVVSFETVEEAVELANDTEYGLSASIYTPDKELVQKMAGALKAGTIDSGKAHLYRPQNPFGGYKNSGIGRQKGRFGFHEACQIKAIAREK